METGKQSSLTAFLDGRMVASGDGHEVARAISELLEKHDGEVLVFDDSTGRVTDLDYRNVAPRGAGRPKLGVQAREVTLLPRHWDWLATQRGGASFVLRRLVDEARGKSRSKAECRDAAYRFMQALCGNMENYEEALRALYAGRQDDLRALTSRWPRDIARYIDRLLASDAG